MIAGLTLYGEAPSSSEEGVGGGVDRRILLDRAAAMRGNPTEPERRLWMELRDSRFQGHKFRRQIVIGRRIVDFFCPAKGLVVEVDGETHDPDSDARQDAFMLRAFGYRTVRFTNHDVVCNRDGVLTVLKLVLEAQPDRWSKPRTTPQPPPLKRRGGRGSLSA